MPADASIPEAVRRYREEHRATRIGPRYRGWAHFGFTSGASLLAIAALLSRVDDPTARELSAVPLTFLFANLAEYRGHRGPMHHRTRFLGLLHERHTLQHHRFYTHDAMAAESSRDFQMTLFPPVLLLFFLGGIAAPCGLAVFLLAGANAGWLFTATAMAYFLTYEWLHWSYHQPAGTWIGRRALVRRLREHHRVHHDPAWMQRANFNITFPICDRLFGTVARGANGPGELQEGA